jgi:hypothetical protein
MRRDRNGLGTLGLVAILVGFVCVVQLAQHVFTGQVTLQTSHSVTGRAAREVALAAVQEARALVSNRLSLPGTPEFDFPRGNDLATAPPRRLTIAPAELPATTALVRSVYENKVELVSISAVLDAKRSLVPGDFDHEGTLTVEARVRSRVEKAVERRVWRTWTYKVVHLAPGNSLRPVVGMFRRAGDILKARVDATQVARAAIEQDLPALVAEIRTIVADIDRQAAQATEAQVKQILQQIRTIYAPLVEGADGGALGGLLARLQPLWAALPALPTDPDQVMLVHRGTALAAGEFDLQGDLADLLEANRRTRDEAIRLGAIVRQQQTADPSGLGVHQQYEAALRAQGLAIAAVGERYVRFRTTFEAVREGEAAYDRLATAYMRLDPVARRGANGEYPLFDPYVTVIMDRERLKPNPEVELRKALARLGGSTGFQGVVIVENGDLPLRLSGAWRGRFVLAATGPLSIDGVRGERPGTDMLTVIHAGEDATLSLNGTIDATVVSRGSRFTLRRGTQITGGLFLDDLGGDAVIEPALIDPERVKPDPVRNAVPDARLRHVVLAPWTRSMGSDRDF